MLQTFIYAIYGLWRTLGLMLAGMALFKWGVLSGEKSRSFYAVVAAAGLAIGLPIIAYGAWKNFANDWSVYYSMYGGTLFNYWGSLFVAVAYISLVNLWGAGSSFGGVKRSLIAVGRMAFSCYIAQTLICTTLFYGHGFGLFGYIPRWGQLCIVPAVWIVIAAGARFWMKRYRFGPLEWLWRTLTYMKQVPMRNSPLPAHGS